MSISNRSIAIIIDGNSVTLKAISTINPTSKTLRVCCEWFVVDEEVGWSSVGGGTNRIRLSLLTPWALELFVVGGASRTCWGLFVLFVGGFSKRDTGGVVQLEKRSVEGGAP